MIELPDEVDVQGLPDNKWSIAKCWRKPAKQPCSGYEIASFKYVYGLVSEVRRLLKAGVSPMPEYWFVSDDDTFVHIPNLLSAIRNSSFSPLEKRVSWAAKGGCNICGGAGWVLSGALAVELATTYGDRFMKLQISKIENGSFHYDLQVPVAVNWVPQASLVKIFEMNPFSVLDKELCRYRENAWHGPCYRTVECGCAPARRPATWHMSISFNGSYHKLKKIP